MQNEQGQTNVGAAHGAKPLPITEAPPTIRSSLWKVDARNVLEAPDFKKVLQIF
jgi:hypothetical protein